ncbi:hypothetical protein MTR67_024056 [Solanum verrucosum]|uniref:NB-ARC domain-containing protein n=1 Tax=Solanum verrucosum TaxID=315347 RepID=A0AAF0R284_SOLVR|nr:hypothetical protein MTR67_024056 [Solanum verrucosum]
MNICYTNLKASTLVEVERFIKKLRETSPNILREYLIHLQEDMDFTHHEKSFDLLARVRELTREEDLKHVYLKAPESSQCCFPLSDGTLFMHMLHMHQNDLLDSNAYSIALIKEEIERVKEDIEFIRFVFLNIELELYKDLWEHILDVAYEAKNAIDSIIVRDNGLLHLIFSLPSAIKRVKLIKEDVSHLLEKIPKNKGLIVVNSQEKRVESNSFTYDKMIVSFKEETNWIIRKLTSGPTYLDVISITGMPGSVSQEYDEKKLLDKLLNQVTGSDLKLSDNVDIGDKLRKQLYGKRYLIVLDDLWDTTTWDELTKPYPEVEKGSRIIFTTREKKVALHGKRYSDPLNIRLLRSEESWELFEERVLGNKSFADELLDVGKEIAQNCKGLPLVVDLIVGVLVRKE